MSESTGHDERNVLADHSTMRATATHPTPRGNFLTVHDPSLHTLLIERDRALDAGERLHKAVGRALTSTDADVWANLEEAAEAYAAMTSMALPDYMAGR